MGPRFFKRGNLFKHGLMLSENKTASMGPRFFKRGNEFRYWNWMGRNNASMGPRFFKRGNLSSTKRDNNF